MHRAYVFGLSLRLLQVYVKAMRKTRVIAENGLLAALSVIILLLGSLIEALDMSSAVLAGFAVLAMRIRWGRKSAIALYAVTSVLAMMLLPNKVPVILYVFYGGLYPILKAEIERIGSTLLQWVLKVGSVLLFFSAGLWVAMSLLGVDAGFTVGVALYAVLVPVSVCADLAMSAIMRQYAHLISRKKR